MSVHRLNVLNLQASTWASSQWEIVKPQFVSALKDLDPDQMIGWPGFQVDILFLDAGPKSDVFSNSHVLEQRKALEHETHPPFLDRYGSNILICHNKGPCQFDELLLESSSCNWKTTSCSMTNLASICSKTHNHSEQQAASQIGLCCSQGWHTGCSAGFEPVGS